MIEQPQVLDKLNKTKLSQEVRKLLDNPDPTNLYLHQAAEKALQMFSPKNPKEAALASQDQRLSILRHTLDNLYLLSLERAYELMTQPLGEELMLQDLIEEKSKEDKLYVLIEDIETNLFESMSLSEVYRIPEPEL